MKRMNFPLFLPFIPRFFVYCVVMKLIIETQSFPPVDYFKKIMETSNVKIEQYENFQKMSFRNRYVIAGANGIQTLTIPVAGGREQKKPIKEVKIDTTDTWPKKHWLSLVSGYRKAPFFDFYAADIQNLLFSSETFLFSFNVNILSWLCKALNISNLVEFTDSFCDVYEKDVDYRNKILPKSFQKNTEDWLPRYTQVFEDRHGFLPNLSILDLLFCEGPNAINLLNSSIA